MESNEFIYPALPVLLAASRREDSTPGELASSLKMNKHAVTYALRVLRDRRLVEIQSGRVRLTERGKRVCLLYTSPSPRDLSTSRMPSSA